MADLLRDILNKNSLVGPLAQIISAYVDDFVARFDKKLSTQQMQDTMQHWLDIMVKLGLEIKPSKTIMPTREPIPILGLMVDTNHLRVFVGPDKIEKYRGLCLDIMDRLRPGDPITRRELARVIGKLNFAAPVVLGGMAKLADLHNVIEDLVLDLPYPQRMLAWRRMSRSPCLQKAWTI